MVQNVFIGSTWIAEGSRNRAKSFDDMISFANSVVSIVFAIFKGDPGVETHGEHLLLEVDSQRLPEG